MNVCVQPENIVSSVGSIAQYTISSFVSFFVLVPFNRLSTKCEERAFVIECIDLYKFLPTIWNVSA